MSEEISDTYRTIAKPGESLFKDRGSKFFGYVFPIRHEDEFRERLEEIRKEHHQARHHCYAFRYDPDDLKYRANDDGEPSHSAGTPILHALQSAEIINCAAVVVRYFGGTKLGVSGLINAYRTATEEAILNTKVVKRVLEYGGTLTTDYAHMSKVLHLLDKLGARIEDQQLEYDCKYQIAIRRSQLDALLMSIKPLENTIFVRRF